MTTRDGFDRGLGGSGESVASAQYAALAQAASELARSWAIADTGIEPDPTNYPGKYSAFHYAMQAAGGQWFRDAGVPNPAVGENGNYYLDELNGDLYQKVAGSWELVLNIVGPAGPQGPQGDPGTGGVPNGGTTGQVLAKASNTDGDVEWVAQTGGSSGPTQYWEHRCALLEPDALEGGLKGTFTYTVASNETKFAIMSWATRIGGSAGRWEVRNPYKAAALRGVTVTGTQSDSMLLTMDPTIPTYTNPQELYYQRLLDIENSPVKSIHFDAASQNKALLLGAYGGIITRAVNFNFTWLILRPYGNWGGYNVGNEIGDVGSTDYQRMDFPLLLAMDKRTVSTGSSGQAGGVGAPYGTITYVLLPSTWSKVTDPNTYVFRDDFMGASLDTTTVWNRTQSSAGNVEIDTNFQWCKLFGTPSGSNSMYSQTTFARSAEREMIVDIYVPSATEAPAWDNACRVGWTTGYTDSSYKHAIDFTNTGSAAELAIWENGTKKNSNVGGYEKGSIYRVSIKLLSGGGATYKIQGGTYGQIGSATWTTITPSGGTSGTDTNLSVGAHANTVTGPYYISDMKVI